MIRKSNDRYREIRSWLSIRETRQRSRTCRGRASLSRLVAYAAERGDDDLQWKRPLHAIQNPLGRTSPYLGASASGA